MKLQLFTLCYILLVFGFKMFDGSTASPHFGMIRSSRILGGIDFVRTDKKDVDCLVSVDNKFRCGCIIYKDNWVITSANCIHKKNSGDVVIFLEKNGEKKHKVKEIHQHERFEIETLVNDIAVVQATGIVKPDKIELSTETPKEGTELELIGFGRLNISKIEPQVRQILRVKTISSATCGKVWRNLRKITENNFCTLPRRGEGACYGDSGSPLIMRNTNGGKITKLFGIVNFAIPCGGGVYPDVFTDISKYNMWIEDKTKGSVNGGTTEMVTNPTSTKMTTTTSTTVMPINSTTKMTTTTSTTVMPTTETTTDMTMNSTTEMPTTETITEMTMDSTTEMTTTPDDTGMAPGFF